jgi:hypothetical protein
MENASSGSTKPEPCESWGLRHIDIDELGMTLAALLGALGSEFGRAW